MGALFDVSGAEMAFSVLISRTAIMLFDTTTAPTTTSGSITAAAMANGNSGIAAEANQDLAMTMESPRMMKTVESASKRAKTTGSVDFNEPSTFHAMNYRYLCPPYNQEDERLPEVAEKRIGAT
jgi:hypothetical protein